MNAEPLEFWIATVLQPFVTAVMETKEELVSVGGTGQDLLPTFVAFRTQDRTSILGSCSVLENRMTGVHPGTTRWMNLCRQVTRLTHSDLALAAIEVTMDDPPIETLEVSMITPESVTTTLRPYRYLVGRKINWLGQAVPDNPSPHLGALLEVEAAQQAWTLGHVAQPASVKYLSELCGCTWQGDQGMIDALGIYPSQN